MNFHEVICGTIFVTLWFSWVSLLFAALPVGIVALLLKGGKLHWIPPRCGEASAPKIHYVIIGLLGGLAGEFVAVSSLVIGEWWICYTQHQLCNDGQGGIVLVFTIPALSLMGGTVALIWTRISLRIPAERPWASVFRYSGPSRLINWSFAIAIQLIFWTLFMVGFYRLTVLTL
jgi:hypothetical protein